MKMKMILPCAALISLCLGWPLQAIGNSGGLILTQGSGARIQSLGETGTGLAGSVDALTWNPAGMAALTAPQVLATYRSGMEGSAFQQLAGAYPWAGVGTWGLGLSLFQGGSMDLDQADGTWAKVQSQSDWAVTLGYALPWNPTWRFGAAVKVLHCTLIEKYTASAAAADVGLQAEAAPGLCLGLSLQNLGTEITYESEGDPLPLTVRGGAAYAMGLGSRHNLTLLLDGVKPNDHDFTLHLGAEYAYAGLLAARVGYKAGYDLEGLTAGLGIAWGPVQLDYAFGLISELTSTHQVSLMLFL